MDATPTKRAFAIAALLGALGLALLEPLTTLAMRALATPGTQLIFSSRFAPYFHFAFGAFTLFLFPALALLAATHRALCRDTDFALRDFGRAALLIYSVAITSAALRIKLLRAALTTEPTPVPVRLSLDLLDPWYYALFAGGAAFVILILLDRRSKRPPQ